MEPGSVGALGQAAVSRVWGEASREGERAVSPCPMTGLSNDAEPALLVCGRTPVGLHTVGSFMASELVCATQGLLCSGICP